MREKTEKVRRERERERERVFIIELLTMKKLFQVEHADEQVWTAVKVATEFLLLVFRFFIFWFVCERSSEGGSRTVRRPTQTSSLLKLVLRESIIIKTTLFILFSLF